MEKEKLIIRNFGPIKNVELELSRFNVLIGDQGTGKSTIAKVYSLLKSFISIKFFNEENEELENNLTWQFEKYLKTFELESFINKETHIYYYNSRLNTTVKYIDSKLETQGITYSSMFDIPRFTYIVAERSFIPILSDALYAINESGAKLPSLFNRFGSAYSRARKENSLRKYRSLIGVDFEHNNGVDFIRLNNATTVPLTLGSSGIQNAIPMLVVFDALVNPNISEATNKKKIDENLIVIEEPEISLFPITQKKIINYLIGNNFYINSKISNTTTSFELIDDYKNKVSKNGLFFTTHSPYVLTSLNNLMYAYKIGQNHNEVNKIIEEQYWVNPNDVSAYMLLNDGTAENILDSEGLIKASKIDSVSGVINEEFDDIMNIELDIKDEAN